MLLRANALAKGYSGARVETVELLLECLNRGVAARTCRPRLGRRERRPRAARASRAPARRRGRGDRSTASCCRGARGARARSGSSRFGSQAKEGLSLVNGTQFMTAMARSALVRARGSRATADIACALSLEALQGSRTSFLPAIHARAPAARASSDSAANVCAAARRLGDHRVAPLVRQGAGRLLAALRAAGARRLPRPARLRRARPSPVELNAATDNPLVLVEDGLIVSNGNFHGQPLAFALDALAIAVAELANISERRVERLVNPSLSDGLPPFLARRAGSTRAS